MKRTLLIMSPSRVSSACIERALASAERAGGGITVLFVLDTALSDEMRARVHDAGFLGKTPISRLLDAIRREQRLRAGQELARIGALAEKLGVDFSSELVEGDFLSTSLDAARRTSARAIFVARQDRHRLARIVNGSAVDDLKESAPCDVRIINAENSTEETHE